MEELSRLKALWIDGFYLALIAGLIAGLGGLLIVGALGFVAELLGWAGSLESVESGP